MFHQRDILSEGIKQSKEIGQWVRDNNIEIEKVFSSTLCRNWKTAEFAGWTKYTKNKIFRNDLDTKVQAKRLEEIRKIVTDWNGKGNLVIITHFKIINPYSWCKSRQWRNGYYRWNTNWK